MAPMARVTSGRPPRSESGVRYEATVLVAVTNEWL